MASSESLQKGSITTSFTSLEWMDKGRMRLVSGSLGLGSVLWHC